jgi:hypothetical protein
VTHGAVSVPAPGSRDRGALAHHEQEEAEEADVMDETIKVWTGSGGAWG